MQGPYELIYWPGLRGRGELVRLALEQAGVPYVDRALLPEDQGGGVGAVLAALRGERGGLRPLAPPILVARGLVLAQTANILLALGRWHELAPADEAGQLAANQLQLTISDLVAEAHDTHHPVSVTLYFEDQAAEARRAGKLFAERRIPKFLGWFEGVLSASDGPYLLGARPTYPDLSLFQVMEGLAWAFPRGFARAVRHTPRLLELQDAVRGLPRVAAYLRSERRQPFNQEGIFRRYPELDVEG